MSVRGWAIKRAYGTAWQSKKKMLCLKTWNGSVGGESDSFNLLLKLWGVGLAASRGRGLRTNMQMLTWKSSGGSKVQT